MEKGRVKAFRGRLTALGSAVIILALWFWQAWCAREQDLHEAEILVSWLARAAESQVDGTVRAIDGLLDEFADRINLKEWPDAELQRWFSIRLDSIPEIRNIVVVDADFRVLGNSFGRDRVFSENLKALRPRNLLFPDADAMPSRKLLIGSPIISPVTGQPSIPMAKAIIRRDGTLDGWLIAGVRPEIFRDQLSAVVIEDQGGAALFGPGAVFLARVPEHENFIGRSFATNPLTDDILQAQPKGVRHFVSPADGHDKVVAYRKLDRFPLMLTVGLTTRTALARWHDQVQTEGMVLLILFTAIFWYASRYDRRTKENDGLAQQHQAARELAEKLLQERSHFFAAASHDLRQPVHAIRLLMNAATEVIHSSDGATNPDLADLIMETEASAAELSSFLDQVLDVSRLEAGKIVPSVVECPLGVIFNDLVLQLMRLADYGNVRFDCVSTSVWVKTDPILCRRALANLLTNAIKFAEGGNVLLGCRRRGDAVEIMVCDSGIGIPESDIDSIFEDFKQLGNNARQREKGIGLGLGIVQRILVMLDHPLKVRSKSGRGTAFSVLVPRAKHREA